MNFESLQQLWRSAEPMQPFYGVVVGLVTNNKDPDDLHRVKVSFPWLGENVESHWARVATPMAGPNRGLYFLPEVDDEVLVAFQHGSIDFPFVIGSLWNGKDKAPENNSDGKNNKRTIRSRSGHIIRLNDTDGSETIEIIDKKGSNKIVINSQDNTITVESQSDIKVTSKTGKLKMKGVGVEISSDAGVKIEAKANVDITANALVNVKGSMIKLN